MKFGFAIGPAYRIVNLPAKPHVEPVKPVFTPSRFIAKWIQASVAQLDRAFDFGLLYGLWPKVDKARKPLSPNQIIAFHPF
jgi:hypothetical protein